MVKHEKIAILGFGREGRSLLSFLRKRGLARTPPAGGTRTNAEVTILDKNPQVAIPHDTRAVLGERYLRDLKKFDVIFRSPGVPYMLSQLYRARCDGVKVTSATKLFFELAAPYRKKLIGVTGTKGKGTTCSLLAHILKVAGKKTILAGNIGKPMLDILPQLHRADYVILELSSFQLQDLPASPHIAVVVDVFPDHQDEHQSLREYYGSKANIGRFQKASDIIFYFADNPLSKSVAAKSPAKKTAVMPQEAGARKNYDMAAAVARSLGIRDTQIQNAIKSFKGLEHRLELVRTIRIQHHTAQHPDKLEYVRVLFVNDSAATNPVAAAAAVRSFQNPLILLAGGRDKGLSYAPLAKTIRESKQLKLVVLYGENKRKMKSQISRLRYSFGGQANLKSDVPIQLCTDLKSAVQLAYRTAKNLINRLTDQPINQIAILLSPASASFDQFKNYPDRGEQFKKMVQALR